MRLRSAIAFCNRFSRNSTGITQNLSISSSPVLVNSFGDVSGHLVPPSPSPVTKSSHSEALSSSLSRENQRSYSTDSSGGSPDVNKVVDEINLKFAEAREEIEMAMESKETVYFDEEAECARAAVSDVLTMFEGLLGKLSESEKAALQRSMGLKIEQLKAELQQLND